MRGNGIDATPARLGRVTEPSPEAESDLTPGQREALLLATAREIENRARRTGTLRVGFQRWSAMRDQVPVYERLGTDTDLDIRVYGRRDWDPPDIPA